MKKGIDVSSHNGVIDWEKAKANGVEFAILRVGYIGNNENKKDVYFERNYAECKRLEIPVGVYVYTYAKTEERVKIGAEWTLKQLEGKTLEMPVYFDQEDETLTKLGKQVLTNFCIVFNTIMENAGFKVGVYANLDWFRNYLNEAELKAKYTIWIAHYKVDMMKYNNIYDMMQYSEHGKVPGVPGNVDMDILYSDLINTNNTTNVINQVEEKKQNIGIVASIQNTLNKRYNLNIAVDNIYGKETKKALAKALQTELNKQFNKGLVVDGIFGNLTRNACVNVRKGAKGNITWILQAILICKNYNLVLDGIFGAETDRAIKQYQKNNNLIVDGIVGKNTWANLLS